MLSRNWISNITTPRFAYLLYCVSFSTEIRSYNLKGNKTMYKYNQIWNIKQHPLLLLLLRKQCLRNNENCELYILFYRNKIFCDLRRRLNSRLMKYSFSFSFTSHTSSVRYYLNKNFKYINAAFSSSFIF